MMKASSPQPSSHHLPWIDYAKSAAIFLVVLLHVHCTPWMSKSINLMIMPCFFIISGYLFRYKSNPSFRKFIAKRTRQLVVPYLWINIIAWIAWVAVLRHYGENSSDSLSWYEPLTGIFAGIPSLLAHDIPLWSILSFFITEIICYPLLKNRKIPHVLIIISAWGTAWTMSELLGSAYSRLPLTLGPSLCGVGFYALGHWWQSLDDKINKKIFSFPGLIIFICLSYIAYRFNSEVEFYICTYGHFPLFLLGSIAGSIVLITLARKIASQVHESALIQLISVGTLIICGFHLLIFALIKGVMLLGFGIEPQALTHGTVKGVCFALVAFILCLPIIIIIRRWFKPLVDK